jgi:hypothetical protein
MGLTSAESGSSIIVFVFSLKLGIDFLKYSAFPPLSLISCFIVLSGLWVSRM